MGFFLPQELNFGLGEDMEQKKVQFRRRWHISKPVFQWRLQSSRDALL